MRSDAGGNVSLWMSAFDSEPAEPLAREARADACVIGAGIAGLTTAYLLAREGRSVIVLDDGPIGGGATSRTSAHVCSAIDDRYWHLENLFGRDGARDAAASHAAAVDWIEAVCRDEKIDCDFRRVDGYLFAPPGGDRGELQREWSAAKRAGLDARLVDRVPVESYDFGPGVRFAAQAQFHPMKYLHGLARAVRRLGGRIHTGARVENIVDGSPGTVETVAGSEVVADAIVAATNSPITSLVAIHTKQAAYRTYVVALPMPKGRAPQMLMWDTPDPYHYVRGYAGAEGEFLIVGGEDHKTGQADDYRARFERLEAWARERFPDAEPAAFRWSGQVMEPVDGLAFIGRSPGAHNVFVITGDSGNGLTHGTLGGLVLSDLIAGRDNAWARLYDPARKTLRSVRDFASENLNVAMQYAQLVTPGAAASTADIARGEGAIVRRGLRKLAVYRDTRGVLHERSALCTHLGCVVAWNAAEKTWDCPCHGSRFDKVDGHPLNGPARTPLRPAKRAQSRKSAAKRGRGRARR